MCDIHVVILCVLSETWHYKLCFILSLDKVLALLSLFPQLLRLRWLVLVPPLLPVVELGEAVPDDGDGEGDDEDAEDGAEAAEHFADPGDGADVPVPHLACASASEIALHVSSIMIVCAQSASNVTERYSFSSRDSKRPNSILSFKADMLFLVGFHPINPEKNQLKLGSEWETRGKWKMLPVWK